jgi:thiamine-monophosphate kinase
MDEFEIIEKYFKPLTNKAKEALGLEDDAAAIKIDKNHQLIISKDLMVEDVHFKFSDGGFNIGSKLLNSNLSDLAASGAKPLYYLLGFSKNKNVDEKFIKDFCAGLKESADKYGISLIGGDSVKTTDKLFFSLTIFGQTKKNRSLKRSTAKKDDLIMVSGYIGDAFLGLKILENKSESSLKTQDKNYLLSRHFHPTPRISLGQNLLEKKLATAAIDVSDGLFADLRHICETSNLSAIIYQNQIPLSSSAKLYLQKNPDVAINDLASGGDDYELIFTIKKKDLKKVQKIAERINVKISEIGYMTNSKNKNLILLNENQQEIPILNYGYKHF